MTLLQILNETVERMNKNEVYREIIYPDGKAGMIQKAIEIELKRTFQKRYPNALVEHPEDNTGLPDIYSYYYGKGIEVKCTKGWPEYRYNKKKERRLISEDGIVRWTNGTIQESDEKMPFLFIKFAIIDNKLIFKMAFFGMVSYNDWTPHCGKDMRITLNTVKKLCKRII